MSTIGWEVFAVSAVERPASTWLAEFLGTVVLASVIISLIRQESDWIGLAVGFTVGMGIIGTASTAFLNPQVALARIFTSGIAGSSRSTPPCSCSPRCSVGSLQASCGGTSGRDRLDRAKSEPSDETGLDKFAVES